MPRLEANLALRSWAERAERVLADCLPPEADAPFRLHSAMRYATLGGGKRLRPCLVYATGAALGAAPNQLDAAAAAVELIHAYSLVHDDLPAMDDDALRRGRPTVHLAYDEPTAILAGDALQALAFAVLARAPLPADRVVAMLRTLGDAAGAPGMAGGQALDLDAIGQQLNEAALIEMHTRKTGALIRAAVRMGALAAAAPPDVLDLLDQFANALGLAFQIRDDILDVEGDEEELGKAAGGKDAERMKPTYASLLGLEQSRQRLADQVAIMITSLSAIDHDTSVLRALAEFTAMRSH
jgi:farnesyl diphosphate synthase